MKRKKRPFAILLTAGGSAMLLHMALAGNSAATVTFEAAVALLVVLGPGMGG